MKQIRPRRYPHPADSHPLVRCGPDVVAALRVDITPGGWGEFRALHEWRVRVVIEEDGLTEPLPRMSAAVAVRWDRFGHFTEPTLLATMRLHTVNLWAGSVVEAADAEDGELVRLLTSAFTDDNEPLPEFEAALDASSRYTLWTPESCVTVDELRVAPQWRGTVLTPFVTALVLSKFAALGPCAFLLTALPIRPDSPEGTTEAEMAEAQVRIAAMYRLLGFQQYDNRHHLGGWFPDFALDDVVALLEGQYAALLGRFHGAS